MQGDGAGRLLLATCETVNRQRWNNGRILLDLKKKKLHKAGQHTCNGSKQSLKTMWSNYLLSPFFNTRGQRLLKTSMGWSPFHAFLQSSIEAIAWCTVLTSKKICDGIYPGNEADLILWIGPNQHPRHFLTHVSLATQTSLQVRWNAPFLKCAQRLWWKRAAWLRAASMKVKYSSKCSRSGEHWQGTSALLHVNVVAWWNLQDSWLFLHSCSLQLNWSLNVAPIFIQTTGGRLITRDFDFSM